MQPKSRQFKENARAALADKTLQRSLGGLKSGLVHSRLQAVRVVPEFEQWRDQARDLKNHTLDRLDHYLLEFERNFTARGGVVHWARDAAEAREIIVSLCQQAGADSVAKGKSMAGEEIGINEALEAAGIEPVETDLGEYIVQLAGEAPSHIIVPAVHKTRQQVIDLFTRHHQRAADAPELTEIKDLVTEARQVLRERFLNAKVGITGANFLVAETGSSVIITNEGNGDLCSTLPDMHIITAGIEKVVPTLEDMSLLTRLLGRSATGQAITAYTTVHTGPKRASDADGPEQMHVVLIDNGRSELLNGELRDMLRCIRCGACINHCPVYGAVGGHAYGWVYPGPMGAVLSPAILGLEEAGELPNACTMNGRCETVCPVRIPLPALLRKLRNRYHQQRREPLLIRLMMSAWSWLARHPRLYRSMTAGMVALLARIPAPSRTLRRLPLLSAWLRDRDFPLGEGQTFLQQWRGREQPHD